jgi:lysozyme
MKLSPLGLAILASLEECKLVGYADSGGIPTAGYGHTGPEVKVGQTYTQAQADAWLAADVGWAETIVERDTIYALDQHQFDALTLLCFNIGAGAFRTSTLLRDLNDGEIPATAEQFLVWDHIDGTPNAGLTKRRKLERALFLDAAQA